MWPSKVYGVVSYVVWHRAFAFVQIMKFLNQFQGFLLIMQLVENWDQNYVKYTIEYHQRH